MAKTLIIAGNGLTLDFRRHAGSTLSRLDPSSPLDWDVRNPGGSRGRLLDDLPRLNKAIREIRLSNPGLSDFAVIDQIIARLSTQYIGNFEEAMLDTELRNYLALAYATFQVVALKASLNGWRWHEYFRRNADSLLGACSFNYDLMLERSWGEIGMEPARIGLSNERSRVLIAKPHGSIDFADQHGIEVPRGYPSSIALVLNDIYPLYSLPPPEWLTARGHVELVPPARASQIRNFKWVAEGYQWISDVGPLVEKCIFIGLSCWPVDVPEIDTIFQSLSPKTEIVVANRTPDGCVAIARRHNFSPTVWRDGPE